MIKVNLYNKEGEKSGEKELKNSIFGLESKESLIHQAFVAQMANARQVLAHTKTRSEVSGGGKKPWKQKGTGRARVGSSRNPVWKGGGVAFGPRNDVNFKKDINKKMKKKAINMVLSDRAKDSKLVVLEDFNFESYSTKNFNKVISNIEKNAFVTAEEKKIKRSILIILDAKNDKLKISGRNLANIKIINSENINIVDLLAYRHFVLADSAVEKIQKQK